jgi:hypothetical protein
MLILLVFLTQFLSWHNLLNYVLNPTLIKIIEEAPRG